MGASLNSRVFSDPDKRVIAEQWKLDVAQSVAEDGNSYSGGIGMLGASIDGWNDLKLADDGAAEEWLAENQKKWKPAKAVSFLRQGKVCWMIGGWCSE